MTLFFPTTFSTCPARSVGLRKPPPREGIIIAMQTHKKGTVSLGEAPHDPQFWNGMQEN
jgi:hypothetical protein